MAEPHYDTDSMYYPVKKHLDRLLPMMLVAVVLYLYLDLIASSQNFLYSYKAFIQYLILAYFVADIAVLFTMYEENRKFFRNHWFDILLTIPFLTTFKGLRGLKIVRLGKGSKLLKLAKVMKNIKVGQKIGKIIKKGRKLVKKAI